MGLKFWGGESCPRVCVLQGQGRGWEKKYLQVQNIFNFKDNIVLVGIKGFPVSVESGVQLARLFSVTCSLIHSCTTRRVHCH